MTGYSGSRDYEGNLQSPWRTPHRSTHPTEKQDSDPLVADSNPLVADSDPLVADSDPLVADSDPLVADSDPLVADSDPLVASSVQVFCAQNCRFPT